MLLRDKDRAGSRHRQQQPPSVLLRLATSTDSRLRAVASWLMDHNLPLAAASGLAIMGVIANGFAALFWGLLDRPEVIWVFSLAGVGSWLFGAGILCLFPPSGAPRHSKRR